jgi:hypothetical protein
VILISAASLFFSSFCLRLAERDPLPHWNEPTLRDDRAEIKATAAESRCWDQNCVTLGNDYRDALFIR